MISFNLISVMSYLVNFELVDVEPPRPRESRSVAAVDSVLLRRREVGAAAAKVGVLRKGKNLQCNVASFRWRKCQQGVCLTDDGHNICRIRLTSRGPLMCAACCIVNKCKSDPRHEMTCRRDKQPILRVEKERRGKISSPRMSFSPRGD